MALSVVSWWLCLIRTPHVSLNLSKMMPAGQGSECSLQTYGDLYPDSIAINCNTQSRHSQHQTHRIEVILIVVCFQTRTRGMRLHLDFRASGFVNAMSLSSRVTLHLLAVSVCRSIQKSIIFIVKCTLLIQKRNLFFTGRLYHDA